jgi:hypothetical protein
LLQWRVNHQAPPPGGESAKLQIPSIKTSSKLQHPMYALSF